MGRVKSDGTEILQTYPLRLSKSTYAEVTDAARNSGVSINKWIEDLIHRELGPKNQSQVLVSIRVPKQRIEYFREALGVAVLEPADVVREVVTKGAIPTDEELYLLWKIVMLLNEQPSMNETTLERALMFYVREKDQRAKKIREMLAALLRPEVVPDDWKKL